MPTHNLTSFDFDFAINTALPLTEAAYQPTNSTLLPEGWTLVDTIKLCTSIAGDELGRLFPAESLNTPFGIVAKNANGLTAVCFRGTLSPIEWRDDLLFRMNGNVEEGFELVFRAVLPSLPVVKGPMFITGHSLGAAVALLFADEGFIEGDSVITFAGPRVGNQSFKAEFDQRVPDCFRVVNQWDVVPHKPPELFGYKHVGTAIEVDSGFTTDLRHAHSLAAYKTGLINLRDQMAHHELAPKQMFSIDNASPVQIGI